MKCNGQSSVRKSSRPISTYAQQWWTNALIANEVLGKRIPHFSLLEFDSAHIWGPVLERNRQPGTVFKVLARDDCLFI